MRVCVYVSQSVVAVVRGVSSEHGGVELLHHEEPDQHRGHLGPEARHHLRVPGAGQNRGRLRTRQRENVLPDHDRRFDNFPEPSFIRLKVDTMQDQ